jgi:pantoate--beta-alanine ligase
MGDATSRDGGCQVSSLAVARTISEIRAHVRDARERNEIVGLVPTMGALHEGHARLVEACRAECPCVVVSIFVNPTQFGPTEDFSRYPRTFDADLELCRNAGATAVFAPGVEEMYPRGRDIAFVEVPGLSDVLEGASRPGHFRGVATVVMKLLQIVGPDRAHFGQKDYQQLLILTRMVEDLNLPVAIRPVATARAADGLALSSRNRYLDGEDRRAATVLSRALNAAIDAVRGGERDGDRVRQILRQTIESEERAKLDYAEVADAATLRPLAQITPGQRAIALLAAKVGPARLIDNAFLSESAEIEGNR